MKPLHLIVTIGGERVAIPTDLVESVVEIETLTPVPRAPPHVAGLAPLRSRVLTIIDCHATIGLPSTGQRPALWTAVVVNIEGHCYGLLVDTVEDVLPAVEPRPATGLSAGWARVTGGIVEHDGEAVLLVTAAALVAGPVAAAA